MQINEQCQWVNDDMDGDPSHAPRWCGQYGPFEVINGYWTCPTCSTTREAPECEHDRVREEQVSLSYGGSAHGPATLIVQVCEDCQAVVTER